MPVKGILCGLPPALSATETAALRVPVAVGLKKTLIAHLVLPVIPLPHVLVWVKSAAFAPVTVIPLMIMAVVETSVNVITLAALVVPTVCALKRRLAGDKDASVPMPARSAVWELPAALSVTTRLAKRVLMFFGAKSTWIVQVDIPATPDPQLLVCEKSAAFVPEMAMFMMVKGFGEPLCRTMEWAVE